VVHASCVKKLTDICDREYYLEHTTKGASSFPQKRHFLCCKQASADCVLSGCARCCYCTLDMVIQEIALAQVSAEVLLPNLV